MTVQENKPRCAPKSSWPESLGIHPKRGIHPAGSDGHGVAFPVVSSGTEESSGGLP